MLTDYISAAMRRATYKQLEGGEGFFGEIPGLDGVWANGDTLEETREDLRQALEGWIVLGLRLGHALPVLDGIDLGFVAAD
jgi:predicted RNase H-like HicB family nuclease